VSFDYTKKCKDCGVGLSNENVYPSFIKARTYICTACGKRRAKEWGKKNKQRRKRHSRSAKLKSKYGITINEYSELFEAQKGVCKICGHEHERRPLNVDHCHSTGRIRGLLCDKCNLAIGLIGDSKDLAMVIVRYLS